jgi:hypothetical protein
LSKLMAKLKIMSNLQFPLILGQPDKLNSY